MTLQCDEMGERTRRTFQINKVDLLYNHSQLEEGIRTTSLCYVVDINGSSLNFFWNQSVTRYRYKSIHSVRFNFYVYNRSHSNRRLYVRNAIHFY